MQVKGEANINNINSCKNRKMIWICVDHHINAIVLMEVTISLLLNVGTQHRINFACDWPAGKRSLNQCPH